MVWDYSLENIKVMHAHNIGHTVHVPLGYSRNMESGIPPKATRDVDVMFIGAMNDRRNARLRPLLHLQESQRRYNGNGSDCIDSLQVQRPSFGKTVGACVSSNISVLNIVYGDNYWGARLFDLYSRSKIALNLHYYGGKTILEVHRILPLIANKVLVLTEASDDPWHDQTYRHLVDMSTDTNMTRDVLGMLQLDMEAEVERRYLGLLACCTYTRFLREAMQVEVRLNQGASLSNA